MKHIVLLSTLVFLSLPAFGAPETVPQRALPQTTIRLDPQRDRGAISPLVYGTNHRYNGDATGNVGRGPRKNATRL